MTREEIVRGRCSAEPFPVPDWRGKVVEPDAAR